MEAGKLEGAGFKEAGIKVQEEGGGIQATHPSHRFGPSHTRIDITCDHEGWLH